MASTVQINKRAFYGLGSKVKCCSSTGRLLFDVDYNQNSQYTAI